MDPMTFKEFCDRHGIAAQTSSIQNSTDPSWDGEVLEVVLPSGTPRPPRVLVRVWDDDVTKSDDPSRHSRCNSSQMEGALRTHAQGEGDLPDIAINFEYKMIEVDAEAKRLAEAQ